MSHFSRYIRTVAMLYIYMPEHSTCDILVLTHVVMLNYDFTLMFDSWVNFDVFLHIVLFIS